LITWRKPKSLFHRVFSRPEPLSPNANEQWRKICSIIDTQLKEEIGATDVVWLTKSEDMLLIRTGKLATDSESRDP
ncbi:MAG TPA: hypothetical protein VG498_08010, partial [Terriglobales bacterium]|nr:hypothetical protein [Terriglobales bacterium]